jgi:AcrR family transcriptional regulator
MRALNPPVLGQVFHAYMKLFRTLRQIFEGPGLEWLTRGRRTARTHMLLEQLFWAAVWLTAFDPEDYDRVLERMLDILVGGFAKPGATWSPVALPLADFAPHDGPEPGRETFLLAATRLINARGYRGASVDKISAELNVTKGSFYHHIDAKDDLVLACFERSFEVMRRAHRLSQNLQGDTWRKLSSLAAGLTEFQLTREGPLLRASALAALPPALQTKIFLDADRIAQRFRATISDGIADGSLRPVDPAIAAMMLSAMLNAGAELAFWVPGIKAKAAPAVFARPLLMGVFER